MRSPPIGAVLPSSAILVFNRPIRALLPKVNKEPSSINANDHYGVLKAYQDKYLRGNDTCKESVFFPTGSTVAVHCEGSGLWMHGIVEKVNNIDHNGWYFVISKVKTGRLIM